MPQILDQSPLTLQFIYAPREYVRGLRAAYDHLARIGLVPAFALIGFSIALVSLVLAKDRSSLSFALIQILVSVALGVAFAVLTKLLIGYLGLRVYQARPPDWQTLTVRASAEVLELHGLGRTITAPWSRIRCIAQRGDLYLIVLPNRSVHFLPERPFAGAGLLSRFRALMREKLGDRARLTSE
jgi:hypothetical protein